MCQELGSKYNYQKATALEEGTVIYNSFIKSIKVFLGKGPVFETKGAGEKGPDTVVPQLIVQWETRRNLK